MKKVDSSVFMDCHDFASAKMDRHAACAARDDRNLFFQQDSRSCGTPKEAEMVFFKCRSLKTQAAGFADDFVGFQAVGAGILLSVNEQAHRAESRKSAAKTTREKE